MSLRLYLNEELKKAESPPSASGGGSPASGGAAPVKAVSSTSGTKAGDITNVGSSKEMVPCPFGGGSECIKNGGNGAKTHLASGSIMKKHQQAMASGADPQDVDSVGKKKTEETQKEELTVKELKSKLAPGSASPFHFDSFSHTNTSPTDHYHSVEIAEELGDSKMKEFHLNQVKEKTQDMSPEEHMALSEKLKDEGLHSFAKDHKKTGEKGLSASAYGDVSLEKITEEFGKDVNQDKTVKELFDELNEEISTRKTEKKEPKEEDKKDSQEEGKDKKEEDGKKEEKEAGKVPETSVEKKKLIEHNKKVETTLEALKKKREDPELTPEEAELIDQAIGELEGQKDLKTLPTKEQEQHLDAINKAFELDKAKEEQRQQQTQKTKKTAGTRAGRGRSMADAWKRGVAVGEQAAASIEDPYGGQADVAVGLPVYAGTGVLSAGHALLSSDKKESRNTKLFINEKKSKETKEAKPKETKEAKPKETKEAKPKETK